MLTVDSGVRVSDRLGVIWCVFGPDRFPHARSVRNPSVFDSEFDFLPKKTATGLDLVWIWVHVDQDLFRSTRI